MDNICNEDICTGCGACKAICPTNSIILKLRLTKKALLCQ